MTVIPYEEFHIKESVLNRLIEAYADRKINEYFTQHGEFPDAETISSFHILPTDLMEKYKKFFYTKYYHDEFHHEEDGQNGDTGNTENTGTTVGSGSTSGNTQQEPLSGFVEAFFEFRFSGIENDDPENDSECLAIETFNEGIENGDLIDKTTYSLSLYRIMDEFGGYEVSPSYEISDITTPIQVACGQYLVKSWVGRPVDNMGCHGVDGLLSEYGLLTTETTITISSATTRVIIDVALDDSIVITNRQCTTTVRYTTGRIKMGNGNTQEIYGYGSSSGYSYNDYRYVFINKSRGFTHQSKNYTYHTTGLTVTYDGDYYNYDGINKNCYFYEFPPTRKEQWESSFSAIQTNEIWIEYDKANIQTDGGVEKLNEEIVPEKFGESGIQITNINDNGWLEKIEFSMPINKLSSLSFYESENYACNYIISVGLPNTVNRLYAECFGYCNIENLYYNGTIEEWNNIEKDDGWKEYQDGYGEGWTGVIADVVHCIDGDVLIR